MDGQITEALSRYFHGHWTVFLWGIVKDKMYSRKPQTVNRMKLYIRDTFTMSAMENLCQEV
jgi:hypothetical protein